jgi:hypothetical protein
MIPVLIVMAVIAISALLLFRWFERYRYSQAWRHSEFRGWAFGFVMWFGGLFGHRLPPPPQTKVEFTSKDGRPSGGPTLPDDAPKEEQ